MGDEDGALVALGTNEFHWDDYLTDEQEQDIENWLSRVADYFESQGFREPRYEAKTSDGKHYEVHVHPISDGSHARAVIDCDNSDFVTKIQIDPELSFDGNGKLTTKAYQDIAHELFHLVQQAYPVFFDGCNVGEWITEGTAEAVGIETARRLPPYRAPFDHCQMGMRSYKRKLYTNDKSARADPPCRRFGGLDYQAQSFWQFLGEYSTRKMFIATEEFVPPDYSYLHYFFETEHPMGTPQQEYAWLEKALRRSIRYSRIPQFHIGLHRAYSRFAGTFASYWKPGRLNLYPGGESDNEEEWIEDIFGKCEPVLISKGASISPVALNIEPVAAGCIKLDFAFTGRVKLVFYASGDGASIDLDSLAISTDGGKKIIRRDPGEQNPDKLGHFTVDAESGTPQYLIISNVARNAGNSVGMSPTIRIVPDFVSTDMATEKKVTKTGTDQTPEEELQNAWESRSWRGKASQKDKSPCVEPFDVSPCGPTTYIHLELIPDTGHLLDEVRQPSMVREERMTTVLGAIVERGEEQVLIDIGRSLREIQKQDGWRVRIRVPRIQPGFTGSFTNAYMAVAKAVNPDGSADDDYRAIGPGWVGTCDDGYHPSSGQVSISEFTKDGLRGTFSAKLVSIENAETCQTAPVSRPIAGSFTITDINWGNTSAAQESSEEDILDDVIEDTNELLPGLISDDMAEYIKEQARIDREEQERLTQEEAANGSGNKKTSGFDKCDCSCELEANLCLSNPRAECCKVCEPVFNLCKGSRGTDQAALTTQEQAQMDAENEAMRQQYEAYVDSFAPNVVIKKQMMEAFDALKTIDEKRVFLLAIPH